MHIQNVDPYDARMVHDPIMAEDSREELRRKLLDKSIFYITNFTLEKRKNLINKRKKSIEPKLFGFEINNERKFETNENAIIILDGIQIPMFIKDRLKKYNASEISSAKLIDSVPSNKPLGIFPAASKTVEYLSTEGEKRNKNEIKSETECECRINRTFK
ncbi:hypothetical protein DERP_008229 [Dermatophagoides pteronyssinus]|uniref:Uncharacterized protein n=1 Tax=Dermatophagoides pteronyssinus TaxID=6956 RepID=A0ABQ8J5Z6_DERPT|nr:hypothetical protein DERP_008229 [Dermatophagoides pteronyssinus]